MRRAFRSVRWMLWMLVPGFPALSGGSVVFAGEPPEPPAERTGALAAWIRDSVPEMLGKKVFLLEGWQWLALAAAAFLGMIVDRIVRFLVSFWLGKLLAKNPAALRLGRDVHLDQPVGILAMAVAWGGMLRLLDLPPGAFNILILAVRVVMAVAGVWASYRLADLLGAWLAVPGGEKPKRRWTTCWCRSSAGR